MNKVLLVLILLIGLGIGRLLSSSVPIMPEKLVLVGGGLLFAGIFAYFSDVLEKWKIQEGQVSD